MSMNYRQSIIAELQAISTTLATPQLDGRQERILLARRNEIIDYLYPQS